MTQGGRYSSSEQGLQVSASPNLPAHRTQIKAVNGKLISSPMSAAISPFVLRTLGSFTPCLSTSFKLQVLILKRTGVGPNQLIHRHSVHGSMNEKTGFSHLAAAGVERLMIGLLQGKKPDSLRSINLLRFPIAFFLRYLERTQKGTRESAKPVR